jgi:polysaccharide biosynthesis protein PslG
VGAAARAGCAICLRSPARRSEDEKVRRFAILAAIALAAGHSIAAAEILHIDPEAQTAFSLPARAALRSIGVNVHSLRNNAALDLAHEAGFEFARVDLLWARVERRGAYRFFAYDALLNALEARGMGALWILDYGHPDHGGSVPRTAEDIAAFGRFAEAAAADFKGRNVRYEIWNEPDTEHFWPPKPNAEEYRALLREAVAAIHRADPAAKVASGGVSRFDLAFLRKAINPDLAADLSAIGVHPYPKGGPETIAPELANVREWALQSFGERLEIWDTEWGYSSTNASESAAGNGHSDAGRLRQGCLAVREILTAWSAGFPLGVWYDLQDDGTDAADPEQNYGLLDASGREKPAMQAVRTVMTAIKGRQYAGMIQDAPPGIRAMRFDAPGDVLFIVWSDQPGSRRKVRYTKDNLLSVTGLMGHAAAPKPGRSREAQLKIDEAAGPIYLLWKRAPGSSTRGATTESVRLARRAGQ